MWLWESDLKGLGFRRKRGDCGYWQCSRRYGLGRDEYISVFARCEQAVSGGGALLVELSEFHVTFPVGENLHFYYHERDEGAWAPAGFTSGAEVRRLGLDPGLLRDRADRVAGALAEALGGRLQPR